MNKQEILEEFKTLGKRVEGINNWITNNPQVTDPNAYEIMDCNVTFAELMSALRTKYEEDVQNGLIEAEEAPIGTILFSTYPEIVSSYCQLLKMDELRNLSTDPFFTTPEASAMYHKVKQMQSDASYALPESEQDKRIKHELLCKSMSVPFYIYQVHRTEPEYKYDNDTEFDSMKTMKALYETEEVPAQFKAEIEALHQKIEASYKYSETTNIKETAK